MIGSRIYKQQKLIESESNSAMMSLQGLWNDQFKQEMSRKRDLLLSRRSAVLVLEHHQKHQMMLYQSVMIMFLDAARDNAKML